MNTNKYLEYYMDSRIYTDEEIQKSINQTKKEFSNKNIDVSVTLNNFGVYVITFKFENKNTYFNKIKIRFRKKTKQQLLLNSKNDYSNSERIEFKEKNRSKNRLERYYGENRYGRYKSTGIYKPY